MPNTNHNSKTDRLAVSVTRWVLKHPWFTILSTILLVFGMASGARHLGFSTNYRDFFSDLNPELLAFEDFQNTYTKNDNFLFVLQPADGTVFSPNTLGAVERVTKEAWSIPFTLRVDSISNFQHTWANEDDLTVEDLISNSGDLSAESLLKKRSVALAEPLLRNNLIASDTQTTGINVTLQYPGESLTEVPDAAKRAREIANGIRESYPDLTVAITGMSMMNNTFAESGVRDMTTLIPLMYGILILMMILTLRTVSGTVITLFVIGFSTLTAMGIAGFMGVKLTPISMTAPTIILTLAIADSVHIILSIRHAMRDGLSKLDAIVEGMRINFLPVTITSLTTLVGFLTLNFSDSPPFNHLGNITAVGIAAAWLISITFLPASVKLLPFKVKSVALRDRDQNTLIDRLANFVIGSYRQILITLGIVVVILTAFVPTIDLNDEWTKYFSKKITFRQDTDFALENLGGLYPMEFSIKGKEPGGVSDPDFLNKIDEFTTWLHEQPEVTHVFSLSDIMKRLNKNMHGDDESYYRIPNERDLAAQYLLLYELSLPYGLDMNDRVNIDKSATRVTATLGDVSTVQTRAFIDRSAKWLQDNAPEHMWASATGATVMFSYIAERNIKSMIKGNTLAIVIISIIMMLALRNFRLGLMSLIPNALPILMTYGLWAILVGVVGMAAATVSATSIGIIVDDTVHFLTKYLRGRREKGMNTADAIRYTLHTVGAAMFVNSLILSFGFAVLAMSTFKINAEMGLLTALAVVIALFFDFLLLPAILMAGSKFRSTVTKTKTQITLTEDEKTESASANL